MPFDSIAQVAWMKHNKPKMYRRWARHTPEGAELPLRKGSSTMVEFHKKLATKRKH